METYGDGGQPYDPRDALADVAASRNSVADRLITPWWYHPALGAILTALVLVGALDAHNAIRIIVALLAAISIGALVGIYQRITGLWVDIRNLGPTSTRWWATYLVLIAAIVGISILPSITDITLPTWGVVLLIVTTFFSTILLGRRIDDAMRADIRSGATLAPKTGQ